MTEEPVTEYALLMSGGGFHVRATDPEIERIYPVAEWIEHQTQVGRHVFRRRLVVVEDWAEVTEP